MPTASSSSGRPRDGRPFQTLVLGVAVRSAPVRRPGRPRRRGRRPPGAAVAGRPERTVLDAPLPPAGHGGRAERKRKRRRGHRQQPRRHALPGRVGGARPAPRPGRLRQERRIQPERQGNRHRGPERHGPDLGRRERPDDGGAEGAHQDVVAVAFSADGESVATASTDGTARTWSVPDGASQAVFAGHAGPLTSVEFSPDSRFLLTASGDRTARVWRNTGSPEVAALLAGDADAVTGAEYSPDGTRVLTASDDGTARLWDPGQPTLAALALEPGALAGASYAGPTRIAVAGRRGRAPCCIPAADGRRLARLHLPRAVAGAKVGPGGKLFAVAAGRRCTSSGSPDRHLLHMIRQPTVVTAIAFSPDGTRLATAGTDGTGGSGAVQTGGPLVLGRRGRGLTGVAFSPDGKLVATSSRNSTATLWDAATGKLLHTLSGHKKDVTSVAFSPDGRARGDRERRPRRAGLGHGHREEGAAPPLAPRRGHRRGVQPRRPLDRDRRPGDRAAVAAGDGRRLSFRSASPAEAADERRLRPAGARDRPRARTGRSAPTAACSAATSTSCSGSRARGSSLPGRTLSASDLKRYGG